MNYLIIDVETTTKNNGNPFTEGNKLVMVGCKTPNETRLFSIEYDDAPYGENIKLIQELIDKSEVLVGFNIKFDLHWLRKYGCTVEFSRPFDTQYGYFVEKAQTIQYPSLAMACEDYFGSSNKQDRVRTEYWDKGLDTTDVPREVLSEYLTADLLETEKLFLEQQKRLTPKQLTLVKLAGLDLLTLQEMEYNGLLYDTKASLAMASKLDVEVEQIDKELFSLFPFDFINWGSNNHKSCILYGGAIKYTSYSPYVKKDGSISPARRTVKTNTQIFPRLVEPVKGSELKKQGYYAVDVATFKRLRAKGLAKHVIELLLKRSELEKVNNTYYKGLPKLMEEMCWGGTIHGNLNQTKAITGRLSSSRPNMQNIPHEVDKLFRSRFD